MQQALVWSYACLPVMVLHNILPDALCCHRYFCISNGLAWWCDVIQCRVILPSDGTENRCIYVDVLLEPQLPLLYIGVLNSTTAAAMAGNMMGWIQCLYSCTTFTTPPTERSQQLWRAIILPSTALAFSHFPPFITITMAARTGLHWGDGGSCRCCGNETQSIIVGERRDAGLNIYSPAMMADAVMVTMMIPP